MNLLSKNISEKSEEILFEIGINSKNPEPDLIKNNSEIIPEVFLLSHKLEINDINIKTSAKNSELPEILFITSYPPRECGIATYSHDLITSLKNKFNSSFNIKACALEYGVSNNTYPDEVEYILDTNYTSEFTKLSQSINDNKLIKIVLIQHEFGFFQNISEENFLQFLYSIVKPIAIVYHTVLPKPEESLKKKVQNISDACESIIVMTNNSASILINDYSVSEKKISVIAHGTHLVPHLNKEFLKEKYRLKGKKVLTTFGLLSSGKSIETTLDALPEIIKTKPEVIFLIIGKTHPGVLNSEGEKYRNILELKVEELNLQNHVRFINRYLPLQDLLEYLQLTDIYLFTSKDPNQAVSGTFAYAMSCACPIISTPIPHARELLYGDTGIIIDFQNSDQMTKSVMSLLNDEKLLLSFTSNTVQRIAPTAWENSAIAHAQLIENLTEEKILLDYRLPPINLVHLKKMTTDFGMIQFSKFNQPDIQSGFTLDDNARALIAMCMHYEITGDLNDLNYLHTYLEFINFCQQPSGNFLNYADEDKNFTEQNSGTNLNDANGRAVWALGFLISKFEILPEELVTAAERILKKALPYIINLHSTRAMAFIIKGLYYFNLKSESLENLLLIKTLADRLVQMYKHESEENWHWYESYLTYANSVLPEAMLYASLAIKEKIYRDIAKASFDFLLSNTFKKDRIKVISNKSWLHKGKDSELFGEQPIDVAYTIMALNRFRKVFNDEEYLVKMKTAFNWFLGKNHLHQIIYNPCTGGCYDGLEETHVNLNQGAESTISYLMARLTIEKYFN